MTRSLVNALTYVLAGCLWTSCSEECTGSIGEVGDGCPVSFDGTAEGLPPCASHPGKRVVRRCGDMVVLLFDGGYSGASCTYLASSGALIGARSVSDIPSYCDGESHTITAGRRPP